MVNGRISRWFGEDHVLNQPIEVYADDRSLNFDEVIDDYAKSPKRMEDFRK
jgi:hypothetical protein